MRTSASAGLTGLWSSTGADEATAMGGLMVYLKPLNLESFLSCASGFDVEVFGSAFELLHRRQVPLRSQRRPRKKATPSSVRMIMVIPNPKADLDPTLLNRFSNVTP